MGIEWECRRFVWRIRKYLDDHTSIRIGHKKYNGKRIFPADECNDEIMKLIESGKPFAAARIGDSELRAIVSCQKENRSYDEKQKYFELLSILAGFFGDINDFEGFVRLMEKSIGSIDLMGVWFNKMDS